MFALTQHGVLALTMLSAERCLTAVAVTVTVLLKVQREVPGGGSQS
jgi:hypothetical protein